MAITGASATPALSATLDEVRAAGSGAAIAIVADVVSDADCARAVVDETVAAFGRLDVLVNNAGRGMRLVSETFTTEPVKFWTIPSETWAAIMDINVDGAFRMARAAMPVFLAQGAGRIVNVSTSDQTMVRTAIRPTARPRPRSKRPRASGRRMRPARA